MDIHFGSLSEVHARDRRPDWETAFRYEPITGRSLGRGAGLSSMRIRGDGGCGYTSSMTDRGTGRRRRPRKDAGLRLRLERTLLEQFMTTCRREGEVAARVLRRLITEYVSRRPESMPDRTTEN